MNTFKKKRRALALLFLAGTVFAQQHDQAALLQSSAWSGTLTWMGDQETESVAVTFESSSGKLAMKLSGTRESCLGELRELQRMSNGTFAFTPADAGRCNAPIRFVSVSRASETELGVMMMSQTDALSQGRLSMDNPSEAQLEDRATLKRPLPESLDGYYRVSESGLLLKLERNPSSGQRHAEAIIYRVVLPDAYAEDAGVRAGDVHGRGLYLPLAGSLTLSELAVFLPEERENIDHCPPIYMKGIDFRLANARRAERGNSSVMMLTMVAQDRQFCARANFDRQRCRIRNCEQYEATEGKKSLLLADEVVARQLARVSRAAYEPDQTYAEVLADLRKRAAQREAARARASQSQGQDKGYFDRGGACGPISCEEEDTLQFIVDQYW